MEPKNKNNAGRYGRLPCNAPLANPYVPFQAEDPPLYETRKALVRGTMYPGLDLPFLGMVNKQERSVTPKSELQALGFAIQELALYLDTHRNDQQALEMYQSYQNMYHQYMMEYSQKHGPLNHCVPSQGQYRWLDDPWPWEYCANKED